MNEPLAIVGIGCRFPGGVNSPDDFWRLLVDGVDAIEELPDDRWNKAKFFDTRSGVPGKSVTKQGGFVRDLDRFDAQFFGISPREASRMDPQQRLLLETAWEAIDDAGQRIEDLRGRKVAVFVGISSWEHSFQVMSFEDRGSLDAYTNTGNALSIAVNRIAFCFDFRGPSVAVDTACSSAMVAAHLACQSVWSGQSEMALIGGVNALLTPEHYVGFSQLGMLSPDGRCKAFDSRANGFVRSEGAGMLFVKPLARALADGDRIYAAIRATGSNQDGRTPGITVPSQESQEALLRETCQAADIQPHEIQYVEAHGTGTPVGDPIETRALGSVLAKDRPADEKCIVGSVKTNIGHLEAGAGAASLIKVALSIYHGYIPGNLHFNEPNPEIDFERLKLAVAQGQPWPDRGNLRLAGINSFGYGGTNAHAILQSIAATPQDAEQGGGEAGDSRAISEQMIQAFPFSARTRDARTAVAGSLRRFVADNLNDLDFSNLVANAALRRSHHEYRGVVFAKDHQDLLQQLEAVESGTADQAVLGRSSAEDAARLAFVCSGQGPQWWGMGRQLLQENRLFRSIVERCDQVVRQLGDWSIVEEMMRSEETSRMAETSISQPCIFALQAGLAEIWRAWGLNPLAVVGHSVGEVAAAYIAGVFELEEAVRIIYHRGRCMDLATTDGRMIAAALTVDEAQALIAPFGSDVSIAAVNGPSSLTLSGDTNALEQIREKLEAEGTFCKALRVSYAFHSKQMDPIQDELLKALADLRPQRASIDLYSTVTGDRIDGTEMDAEYWWRNVRQSVLFADAMVKLADANISHVVELSPHPVLLASVNECFDQRKKTLLAVESLRRFEDEHTTMLRSMATLYVNGVSVDWKAISPRLHKPLRFPNYPWQKIDSWYESDDSRRTRLAEPDHPLLGCRRDDAGFAWQNRIDVRVTEYLRHHRVQDAPVLPASAYVEMALAAARIAAPEASRWQVEDLKLLNPLVLSDDSPRWLTTRFQVDGKRIEFASRAIGGTLDWTEHCAAKIRANDTVAAERLDEAKWKEKCPIRYSQDDCYEYFAELGLQYAEPFRSIVEAWRGDTTAFSIVQLPENEPNDGYLLHPAFLDSCFQSVIVALPDFNHTIGELYLPIEIKRIRLYQPVDRTVKCVAHFTELTHNWRTAEIRIYNQDGTLAVEINGLRSQRVTGAASTEKEDELLYQYRWQEASLGDDPLPIETDDRPWLIFADQSGIGDELATKLRAMKQSVVVVRPEREFSQQNSEFTIRVGNREDLQQLLKELLLEYQQPCQGIVHLWNLDAPHGEDCSTNDLEKAQVDGVLSQLHLVQAWENVMDSDRSRLFVVTRGAQAIADGEDPLRFAQGPAIGFGRVIISEYPKLHCKLVDLDLDSSDTQQLLMELFAADDEDEIAYRQGVRFVHRYAPAENNRKPIALNGEEIAYRLSLVRPGTVDGLDYEVVERGEVGESEVEIQVMATALNFSDVMKALGLYPGLEPGDVPLGAECSGIVTRVGSKVSRFRVGDAVLAFAAPSFGSHVVTDEHLVAKKPTNLTFEEAATVPIAFLTAHYALNELGRMARGERVLIHSASGGVGLAAIQLAQLVDAEIFATAGTDEKRAYLREQGIRHVSNSRSLAFVDDVMAATDGDGVDLILNSLPGDAIEKGLEILAEYGRFLEIGKRDIYKDTPVGLFPFRNNLSFFAIDLDRVMRQRPQVLGRLLDEIVEQLENGKLRPLQHVVYDSDNIVDAFRFMQKGQHIGKIVISMKKRPQRILPGQHRPTTFRSDGSYLVTGGFGGFGLALAKWLVDRGAKHLILMGRRGAATLDAQASVKELEASGANVVIVKGDVTDRDGLATALQSLRDQFPPIRGVFHAAMILEDALLTNLDDELFWKVMRPKLTGAWNLHQLTQRDPLDHFVMFSSLSSVFGHAGQGNYAAANAFLDSLAHYRRANHLPALTVNWGHVGEVGYLAERNELSERLERQGVLSFTVSEAMHCLDQALHARAVQISVMRVDWSRWTGLGVNEKISPRFAHLMPQQNGIVSTHRDIREQMLSVAPERRPLLAVQLLRDKIVGVLGISADNIDDQTPLLDFGLDSLMAVELRNWIETEFRISVPIVELMRSPSLAKLAGLVCENFDGGSDQSPAVASESDVKTLRIDESPEKILANMDDLSDEEVDRMLEELIQGGEELSPP